MSNADQTDTGRKNVAASAPDAGAIPPALASRKFRRNVSLESFFEPRSVVVICSAPATSASVTATGDSESGNITTVPVDAARTGVPIATVASITDSNALQLLLNAQHGTWKLRLFTATADASLPDALRTISARGATQSGALSQTSAVDLAMLLCNEADLSPALRACAAAGIPFAVVLPQDNAPLSDERTRRTFAEMIRAVTRETALRVIGPGSFGFMRPSHGLNLTFSEIAPPPGKVAFLAHSGAMGTAIIDWCRAEGIGLSAFVSTGGMADVNWGDLLSYFGEDPETESIVISMETLGEARSFISAARETALTKPVIVLKAGRSSAGAFALSPFNVATGTGASASTPEASDNEDAIIDAVFRRCSVLRVNTIAELFYMAHLLAKQPRPRGGRLAIISNAVGPALLAADALVLSGGALAVPSEATAARLRESIPTLPMPLPHPLDLGGDADGTTYRTALQLFAEDPGIDGILLIFARQPGADPVAIARALSEAALPWGKPVLASWMGGTETETASDILAQARIPVFPYPDTPARLFGYLWRFTLGVRALYETPAPTPQEFLTQNARQQQAAALLQLALSQDRTELTEAETFQLLHLYGISTDGDEPGEAKEEANPPATDTSPKAHPATTTSSATGSSVTLVPLRLEFRAHDQFGPVVIFGTGGPLTDIMQDYSMGLPPLTSTLARRIIERTRIATALHGKHGFPLADVAALEEILVRFSQLAVEQPRIARLIINPLFASTHSFVVAGSRTILHPAAVADADLPRPAVRPYPAQYAGPLLAKSRSPGVPGRVFLSRPIRPDDEPAIVRFHSTVSEESAYSRYFHHIGLQQRITHERLTRVCFNDYDREIALIVEPLAEGSTSSPDALIGSGEIVAVGRLSRTLSGNDGEFAMLISDPWQSAGIGTALLLRLVDIARAEGLDHLMCDTFSENRAMQRVCLKAGFLLSRDKDDPGVVRMTLKLR
ncbi:MAG: bifunctional acetate--CoA ligase family protein/GNAT family N-acetyltransferase [Candidatus Methylacidiphilales bacterium]|nr:GNAT family N-acetyltransferase [Candidatus Methylacidiphilales bacterium]